VVQRCSGGWLESVLSCKPWRSLSRDNLQRATSGESTRHSHPPPSSHQRRQGQSAGLVQPPFGAPAETLQRQRQRPEAAAREGCRSYLAQGRRSRPTTRASQQPAAEEAGAGAGAVQREGAAARAAEPGAWAQAWAWAWAAAAVSAVAQAVVEECKRVWAAPEWEWERAAAAAAVAAVVMAAAAAASQPPERRTGCELSTKWDNRFSQLADGPATHHAKHRIAGIQPFSAVPERHKQKRVRSRHSSKSRANRREAHSAICERLSVAAAQLQEQRVTSACRKRAARRSAQEGASLGALQTHKETIERLNS